MNANLEKSLQYIKQDLINKVIDVNEANVRFVLAERFRIIERSIPSDVRKALMTAVKEGRLIRRMKTANSPEYFCHPNWEHLAKQEIYRRECKKLSILKSVLGTNKQIE